MWTARDATRIAEDGHPGADRCRGIVRCDLEKRWRSCSEVIKRVLGTCSAHHLVVLVVILRDSSRCDLYYRVVDVSVLFCTRNPRADYLNRVLAALKNQTLSMRQNDLARFWLRDGAEPLRSSMAFEGNAFRPRLSALQYGSLALRHEFS